MDSLIKFWIWSGSWDFLLKNSVSNVVTQPAACPVDIMVPKQKWPKKSNGQFPTSHAWVINLTSVMNISEASVLIDSFFVTLQELFNYLTKSTTRFEKFKDKVDSINDAFLVKNLRKTRWTGRAESVRAVWTSCVCIIETPASLMKIWEKLDRDARLVIYTTKCYQWISFYRCFLWRTSWLKRSWR